jgi:ATP-dependent helicase STH1/SNF2
LETDELISASGKIELLDRIVPKLLQTGHRILLFSQMTTAIKLISSFLNHRKIKHLILDGSTKLEERT